MEILRTIALYAEARKMHFLVIGGHALNVLGISRHTGDLDLVVPQDEKSLWLELMERMGYQTSQNQHAFSRHAPAQLAAWPIDLMYVNSETFDKLSGAAALRDFSGVKALTASPEHLVAMKLHALHSDPGQRRSKDIADIAALFSTGIARMEVEEFAELCERYQVPQLFDELKGSLQKK